MNVSPSDDADDPRYGECGFVNEVLLQGQLLVWRRYSMPRVPHPKKKRKEVHGLSQAARFRMLKMVAGIDWQLAGDCHFLTLTYPDHYHGMHYRQMSIQRWLFWRLAEQKYGKHISGIWRIEWKTRKTGSHVGEIMPHVHVITFKQKYVYEVDVASFWGKAIGWENYVDVDVERMKSPKQVGIYIAKYIGKLSSSLGNASYLSKIPAGRTWGKLRGNGFPMAECRVFRFRNSAWSEACRGKALENRPLVNEWGNESFTLLGDGANLIGKVLLQKHVDGEIPSW